MHDKCILKRYFREGELVLSFNFRLKLILGKLCYRWFGPFLVRKVTSYGAVDVWNNFNELFTINEQKLSIILQEIMLGMGMFHLEGTPLKV